MKLMITVRQKCVSLMLAETYYNNWNQWNNLIQVAYEIPYPKPIGVFINAHKSGIHFSESKIVGGRRRFCFMFTIFTCKPLWIY